MRFSIAASQSRSFCWRREARSQKPRATAAARIGTDTSSRFRRFIVAPRFTHVSYEAAVAVSISDARKERAMDLRKKFQREVECELEELVARCMIGFPVINRPFYSHREL